MKLANDIIWFLSNVYPNFWSRYDTGLDAIVVSPRNLNSDVAGLMLVLDENGKEHPHLKNEIATLDSGAKIKAALNQQNPATVCFLINLSDHLHNFLKATKRITR